MQALLDLLFTFFEPLLQFRALLSDALFKILPIAIRRRRRGRRLLIVAHGATSPCLIIQTLPCARRDCSQSRSRSPTRCCSRTSSTRREIVSSFGGVTLCRAY